MPGLLPQRRPLKPAQDAVLLDNSDLSIEESVDLVLTGGRQAAVLSPLS
jgi:cytidylate kinase